MDDLPENQLVTTLKELEVWFREIKNKQIIGSRSQQPVRYFTNYAADVVVTFPLVAIARFRITFTPDNTGTNQGLVYRLMYTYFSGPENQYFEISFIREPSVGIVQNWIFTIDSDPGTVYLKLFFDGASTGTIGIVPL